ncbi:MAG: 2-hydroxyacyl-CoA dehydratase family protein [Dehalococcoidia bacterium]|nr:2-hydroxyacyl-CoA dehydratase family protein [Dehalococcoidia bacterium]
MPTPFSEVLADRHQTVKRYRRPGQKVIAWLCSYFPEEIVYAAGMYPVRMMGGSGETTTADAHLYTNMCSLVRSCLEEGFKGAYDYLDGFVTLNTCDHIRRLYDVWGPSQKTVFNYVIPLPHTISDASLAYFHHELGRFKEAIEAAFGVNITAEAMEEAIRVYNRTRTLLHRLNDLRKLDEPPITGAEFLEAVVAGTILPKDVYNLMLEQYLLEVEFRPGIPTGEKIRLLLVGSEMDDPEYVRMIEDMGGLVVADELCTGTKYFWNLAEADGDPLMSIARRYLTRPECPRMRPASKRLAHMKDMMKEHKVDAVVMEVIKFCNLHGEDYTIVRNYLRRLGVPLLQLSREYNIGAVGQMRTRVEAFFERIWGA